MKVRHVVSVVDDDDDARQSIVNMASALGYECDAHASGRSFLEKYDSSESSCRCLFIDYSMPEMNGLELLEAIHQRAIAIPVVLYTKRLETQMAVDALRSGAVNVVEKPLSLMRFEEVVNEAFAANTNIKTIMEARRHHLRFDKLTSQEKEIVRLAAEGVPNKQIATRLGLSIKTVEKHRRRAYMTLKVGSTAEMARAVTLHSLHSLFEPPASKHTLRNDAERSENE